MVQTGGKYEDDSYVREMEVKTDSPDMQFLLRELEDGQGVAVTYCMGDGKDIYPRYRVILPPEVIDVESVKQDMKNSKIISVYMEFEP